MTTNDYHLMYALSSTKHVMCSMCITRMHHTRATHVIRRASHSPPVWYHYPNSQAKELSFRNALCAAGRARPGKGLGQGGPRLTAT